ncbi:hypothetical protein [Methylobacterium indicum]|uniref:hypothetical protein n=1 Tax=Methylobacterium indicum TaxID=1775910 RepID=UPI001A930EF8|nr:hypothetical protein [Methylobacterium indicum]
MILRGRDHTYSSFDDVILEDDTLQIFQNIQKKALLALSVAGQCQLKTPIRWNYGRDDCDRLQKMGMICP